MRIVTTALLAFTLMSTHASANPLYDPARLQQIVEDAKREVAEFCSKTPSDQMDAETTSLCSGVVDSNRGAE
jgi:hypothetical protein